MANPQISPTSVGATTYTIQDSKAVIADLRLAVPFVPQFPTFEVRYPTAAAGVQITLRRGATSLNLLPGPVDDSATFADRRIIATVFDGAGVTSLTCEIQSTGAPGTDDLTLQVTGLAGGVCNISQSLNTVGTPTIRRVICDPVAAFTVAGGTTVKEQAPVTLNASLGTPPTTLVLAPGALAPTVTYAWSYAGQIAITEFPACGPSQTQPFNAPGVYGDTTIDVTLDVWLDGDCLGNVGVLQNASPPQTITIQTRPRHVSLVLDRSGSMSGSRFANARTGAQILAQTFAALREGVNANDRIEILVFEDAAFSWHNGISPLIGPVPNLALGTPSAIDAAVCGANFGAPGSFTPIGDGLITALDHLATLGVANDPKFTIILLTDGFENTGTIKVDPNTVTPASTQTFAAARVANASRQAVNSRLSIFAIGLGQTVQEDVLDALPLPTVSGTPGKYRQVVDVNELKEAIAQMLTFSQEAQSKPPLGGGPAVPDPDAMPGSKYLQARYFDLEAKSARLAVSVEWPSAADTLELAKRDALSSPNFIPVGTLKKCTTHGMVTADLAALYGGEANVPATGWRILHESGAGAVALPDSDLIIIVDLFVKMDVVFDRQTYRTGDSMVVTARLRAGDQPIVDAKVLVQLARPGESLGDFLGRHSQGYRPPRQPSGDVGHPKAEMLRALLERLGLKELPIKTPNAIFTDGSDQLFDDGLHHDGAPKNGNFANIYGDLDMEGTYTWQVYAEGILPDGTPFSRIQTISRWVGVNVDPNLTELTFQMVEPPSRGQLAATIVVRPMDKRKLLFGPFRTAEIDFQTTAGRFAASTVDPLDGSYSRLLVFREGERPRVTVTVQGKKLRPIDVGARTINPRELGRQALEDVKSLGARAREWIARLID